MLTLTVNGIEHRIDDVDPAMPLLWVLRDSLNLVGAKYGCGVGQCGACTVWVDDHPVRSCSYSAVAASEHAVTTIEGLSTGDAPLHPVQQAWIDLDVPQCGYCQAGQIMSAAALLQSNADPTDADIDQAMAGNLCRCGTYIRIRKAIHAAARTLRDSGRAS